MSMMKGLTLLGIVAVLSVGLSGVAYSSDPAPATVAQFLSRLAVQVKVQPSRTTESKAGAVKPATVQFDSSLNVPLTYDAVSRIAADLGVAIAPPANPGAVVSQAQAGAIASLIMASRAGASVEVPADDVPNQCLTSSNRGSCVDCCKEATGLGGQFCGRFCHANVPPPVSPGEPQP